MTTKMTKRIYYCKECLGKTCTYHVVCPSSLEITSVNIPCPDNVESKSWTWVASIPVIVTEKRRIL